MKSGMQQDKLKMRATQVEHPTSRGLVAILLASICISLFLFPAQASAYTKNSPMISPTLQIAVGFEDDSRLNYWTPVQVALSNEGSNFSGVVSVTTYAGLSRPVVVGSILPW